MVTYLKISEMIGCLKEIKEKYGDLPCVYACDDEGNGYDYVWFEPNIKYILKRETPIESTFDKEDIEEDEMGYYELVCLVN